MKKVCIVGMGNMGGAIFKRLEAAADFEVVGVDRGDDVNEAVGAADFCLIAVKPQGAAELSEQIEVDMSDKVVISIMAGVGMAKLSELFGSEKIVRMMPGMPLQFGDGFAGWTSKGLSEEEKVLVRDLIGRLGDEMEVSDESKIDEITALYGSGLAYYYRLNRAFRMKALEMGFDDEASRKIVRATFLGAAGMLEKSGECSGKLISKIASKGGTTEAAMDFLDNQEFDKLIAGAVEASINRAKDLNK